MKEDIGGGQQHVPCNKVGVGEAGGTNAAKRIYKSKGSTLYGGCTVVRRRCRCAQEQGWSSSNDENIAKSARLRHPATDAQELRAAERYDYIISVAEDALEASSPLRSI